MYSCSVSYQSVTVDLSLDRDSFEDAVAGFESGVSCTALYTGVFGAMLGRWVVSGMFVLWVMQAQRLM